MENNNRSKASKRMMKLIATQLKEMSKTTPLRKITVNDIAEFCEINRSTFYYHFIDKQDAINYVYHSEVTEPLRQLICQGESDNLSLFSLQRMEFINSNMVSNVASASSIAVICPIPLKICSLAPGTFLAIAFVKSTRA